MTIYKNSPTPGVDYSQYQSWEKVTLPNGAVYYIPPGFPQYVYDPSLSSATGRTVLHTNPSASIKQQQDANAAAKKQADLAADQSSPLGQAVPVLTGVGGLILANKVNSWSQPTPPPNPLLESLARAKDAETAAKYGTTTTTQANAAAQGASGITESNIPIAGQSNIPPAPGAPATPTGLTATQVQIDPATGQAVTDAGSSSIYTLQNGVSAAGAAYGAYKSLDALQHGGTGLRGSLTGMGASIGGFGGPLAPITVPLGAAMGNLAGYGLKGDGIMNHLALAANPLTLPLEIARDLGFDVIHKTTKQTQQEDIANLAKQAPDDAAWQGLLAQHAAAIDAGPKDPSKPFFGKYANWDEYKAGGLNAANLAGTNAILNTLGSDYLKYTPEQRIHLTQLAIDNNLLESKHGEVVATDQSKMDALKSQIGTPGVAVVSTTPTPAPTINTGSPLPVGPAPDTTGITPPPVAKWIIRNGQTVRIS